MASACHRGWAPAELRLPCLLSVAAADRQAFRFGPKRLLTLPNRTKLPLNPSRTRGVCHVEVSDVQSSFQGR